MRGAPRSSKHLFCNRIEIPVCFKFVPVCLLLEGSPLGVESRCQLAPQASCRTVPSAQADGSMPASGPRHVRGPLPSPIRPSKRPLPIHSTRCATYGGLTTRVPQASCRTVPSAQADGSMPASGPRHARGPLPSPIRPSKRPLPIHSTRCASYTGAGPRDGTVSLSQLISSCSQETAARCECRV